MNEAFFVSLYFAYFTACILVASILFAIIRYRSIKRQSFAFFSLVTKIYNWLLFVCFGVSVMNFNKNSALYIVLPCSLIFSFALILSRMRRVSFYFVFMLFWTSGFSCFMHTYYLTHLEEIISDFNLFEGSISYFNIFSLQCGISFCFVSFANLGYFTETIRPIVKLKSIKITENNENSESSCPICLESFINDDNSQPNRSGDVVLTKCNHSFHRQCIQMHCDQNIQNTQHNPQCPMCRTELGEQDKVCFC